MQKRHHRRIFLPLFWIVSFCYFPSALWSQTSGDEFPYVIRQWTAESGLPQNGIVFVHQGPKGYLWIGTYSGLVRFDGRKFKVFDSPDSKSENFKSAINCPNGDLWFSTSSHVYTLKNSELIPVDIPKGIRAPEIVSYDGKVILRGLSALWAYENDKFEKVFDLKLEAPGALDIQTYQVVDGKVYVQTSDSLLFMVDDHGTSQIEYHKRFMGIFTGPEDKLYSRTLDGFLRIEGENITPVDSSTLSSDFKTFKDYIILNDSIHVRLHSEFIEIIKNGEIYFCDGSLNKKFARISTVHSDSEGNLWVGSLSDGLFALLPKLFHAPNINYRYFSGSQFVYVGDSLVLFDCIGGGVGRLRLDSLEIPPEYVYKTRRLWTCLMEDGSYWYSGMGGFPFIYDPVNDSASYIPLKSWTEIRTTALFKDSKNRIWHGGGSGLSLYDPVKRELVLLSEETDTFRTHKIYEHRNDSIYFACDHGVGFCWDKKVSFLKISPDFPYHLVRSAYVDSMGVVWIGTAKRGLFAYYKNQLFGFGYSTGKLGRDVWTIIEDDFGFFWMSSNSGVYRAKKQHLIDYMLGNRFDYPVSRFGTMDGMPNSEFNAHTQNKGDKDKYGRLWFSSVGGPVFVNSGQVIQVPRKYSIYAEDVVINGISATIDDLKRLPSDVKQISVTINYPYFYRNEDLYLEYRLKGFYDRWQTLEKDHKINITGLRGGEYTLEVRSINSDKRLSIPIHVETKLTEKTWFRVILWVTGVAIFTIIIQLILRRRRDKAREMGKTKKRMSELELQAFQAQMNPHFIFNSLSSIQSLFLSRKEKEANAYLGKFAALMRNVTVQASMQLVPMAMERELLSTYVDLENLQFDDPMEFEFVVHDIDVDTTRIPSSLLQPLVENAIKHGIIPKTNGRGKITIECIKEDDFIEIHVRDNGIGRDASRILNKQKYPGRKSHGLNMILDRISTINGLHQVEISLFIDDLTNNLGEPIGTEVILFVPLELSKLDVSD